LRYYAEFNNAISAELGDQLNLYPIGLSQYSGDINPPHHDSYSNILYYYDLALSINIIAII